MSLVGGILVEIFRPCVISCLSPFTYFCLDSRKMVIHCTMKDEPPIILSWHVVTGTPQVHLWLHTFMNIFNGYLFFINPLTLTFGGRVSRSDVLPSKVKGHKIAMNLVSKMSLLYKDQFSWQLVQLEVTLYWLRFCGCRSWSKVNRYDITSSASKISKVCMDQLGW